MRIGLQNGDTIQWLAGEPGVSERVHSSVRDFALTGDRQLEIVPFVKGGFTRQFDRGNQANEITFGTTRTFASADLTFLFKLDYLDNIQLTGTIVFQIDVPGGGTETRYMANSVMQRPEMDPIGDSLMMDFSVSGGQITSGGPGHYLTASGDAYLNAAGDNYLTGT